MTKMINSDQYLSAYFDVLESARLGACDTVAWERINAVRCREEFRAYRKEVCRYRNKLKAEASAKALAEKLSARAAKRAGEARYIGVYKLNIGYGKRKSPRPDAPNKRIALYRDYRTTATYEPKKVEVLDIYIDLETHDDGTPKTSSAIINKTYSFNNEAFIDAAGGYNEENILVRTYNGNLRTYEATPNFVSVTLQNSAIKTGANVVGIDKYGRVFIGMIEGNWLAYRNKKGERAEYKIWESKKHPERPVFEGRLFAWATTSSSKQRKKSFYALACTAEELRFEFENPNHKDSKFRIFINELTDGALEVVESDDPVAYAKAYKTNGRYGLGVSPGMIVHKTDDQFWEEYGVAYYDGAFSFQNCEGADGFAVTIDEFLAKIMTAKYGILVTKIEARFIAPQFRWAGTTKEIGRAHV